MTSSPNTGPTVPAWIRDQIGAYERSWPLVSLGTGVALSILLDGALGVLICTANSPVYYARP
jgi:hypothetical protein